MRIFYRAVAVMLLAGMLTITGFAASEKTSIFVGSTELSKILYEELNNSPSTITIDDTPENASLKDAMWEALAQNPYAAHANGWNAKTYTSRGYTEISPDYVHKVDVRKKQKTDLQKKVKEVVKEIIKENMTTEQKVDAIQRYIAANCEYDSDTLKQIVEGKDATTKTVDSFTAYGALINGKAVCQGYANAFKALADAAGIRNVVIFGTTKDGIPHSWNRVYDNKTWQSIDSSNLDLNMWKQTGAYVASSTVKERLIPNKQAIVDSKWKSLFSSES